MDHLHLWFSRPSPFRQRLQSHLRMSPEWTCYRCWLEEAPERKWKESKEWIRVVHWRRERTRKRTIPALQHTRASLLASPVAVDICPGLNLCHHHRHTRWRYRFAVVHISTCLFGGYYANKGRDNNRKWRGEFYWLTHLLNRSTTNLIFRPAPLMTDTAYWCDASFRFVSSTARMRSPTCSTLHLSAGLAGIIFLMKTPAILLLPLMFTWRDVEKRRRGGGC